MTASTAPAFWPFAGHVGTDCYSAYRAQREVDPVCPVPGQAMYVVTRHRYVCELLRDPRCSAERLASAEEMGRGRADLGTPLERTMNRMAAFSDPPRHEHVRRPLQQAFAPHVVAPLRSRFADLSRERVAAVDAQRDQDGIVDAAGALVEPLMNAAMAGMLRLSPDAAPMIRELWSQAGLSADGPGSGVTEHSPRRLAEIHAYLGALLKAVRAQPADDPLGVLVRAADTDPSLGDADLVANLIFVINSAHRAVAQAFGLFIHTLATHQEAWAMLRERPELVPRAVESLLRHDTSVQFTSRRVTADIDLGDHALEEGSLAVLMLGAANRDPERFAEPDAVSLEQTSAGHLAFGYGPHFCAGAAVSRMVLAEALAALVARAPRLELAEPPVWTTFRPNMRGCDRLAVRW